MTQCKATGKIAVT